MEEIKVIELNSNPKSIIKLGLTLRASFVLMTTIGLLLFAISIFKESPVFSSIFFIIASVLFYIFFRILNSAFFREFLLVTKHDMTVTIKNLSNEKKYVFPIDQIKYFGFSNQQYTKHPLDNPTVDFTGLAAAEKELQYIIDEGNIKIEAAAQSIKFGKNLPSWDIEELIKDIELFTGREFAKPLSTHVLDYAPVEPELDEEPSTLHETETSAKETATKKYTYTCDEGELVVMQKHAIPSGDDTAFLNGKLAPTKKFQVGIKQFILVSNGIVYAVRGFND